jgi:hypothetical protein
MGLKTIITQSRQVAKRFREDLVNLAVLVFDVLRRSPISNVIRSGNARLPALKRRVPAVEKAAVRPNSLYRAFLNPAA